MNAAASDRRRNRIETGPKSAPAGPYVHIGLTPNKLGNSGIYPTDLGESPIRPGAKGEAITRYSAARSRGSSRLLKRISFIGKISMFIGKNAMFYPFRQDDNTGTGKCQCR